MNGKELHAHLHNWMRDFERFPPTLTLGDSLTHNWEVRLMEGITNLSMISELAGSPVEGNMRRIIEIAQTNQQGYLPEIYVNVLQIMNYLEKFI